MERVIVVGPPGAGKSTLAERLAGVLDCPHIELDGLWWDPDWTEAGAEVFGDRARAATAAERWVADGNYFSQGSRDVLWPQADTVVFLDHPRRVTIPRVFRRTMWRALARRELWNGNRESIRMAVRPDSIILFAWRAHPGYGRRYGGLIADAAPDLAHVTWVRLRSPREVRRWLRDLGEPAVQPRT